MSFLEAVWKEFSRILSLNPTVSGKDQRKQKFHRMCGRMTTIFFSPTFLRNPPILTLACSDFPTWAWFSLATANWTMVDSHFWMKQGDMAQSIRKGTERARNSELQRVRGAELDMEVMVNKGWVATFNCENWSGEKLSVERSDERCRSWEWDTMTAQNKS